VLQIEINYWSESLLSFRARVQRFIRLWCS